MDKMIEDKIYSLPVTESWKFKFREIAESKPISFGLNLKFENKERYQRSEIWTKVNGWAILFGVFFYFFKGMWKKGLSLLGIAMICVWLSIDFPESSFFAVMTFLPSVLAAAYANSDYYRKMVLEEDFWF